MQLKSWVKPVLAAILLGLAGATPASADIKAYNAAVTAGDYKKAAAEAKATWATWDKTDSKTALFAREFGFISYVAGDYAAAREFGEFLKANGATLPTPDDLPFTSRVLLAAANYKLDSGGSNRQDLFNALQARETSPGIDMQTVLASEALYGGDFTKANWDGARESAKLSQRLLERGGDLFTQRALEARAIASETAFLGSRNPPAYDEIVDTHDAVVAAIDSALTLEKRQALLPLKFRMEAWAFAVEAYFQSVMRTGSSISKKVTHRDLAYTQWALFQDTEVGPDHCRTTVDLGSLKDYENPTFRGIVSAVILKVDVNDRGEITKSEILAAVPYQKFGEDVKRAVPSMRFKRAREAKPNCTLAAKSLVQTIYMTIQ